MDLDIERVPVDGGHALEGGGHDEVVLTARVEGDRFPRYELRAGGDQYVGDGAAVPELVATGQPPTIPDDPSGPYTTGLVRSTATSPPSWFADGRVLVTADVFDALDARKADRALGFNPQAGAYTVKSTDVDNVIVCTGNAPQAITMDTHQVEPVPVGTRRRVFAQGSGGVKIDAPSQVTVEPAGPAYLAQGEVAELVVRDVNRWLVIGGTRAPTDPMCIEAPLIEGVARTGQVLSITHPGIWPGAVGYRYQWIRDGGDIPGEQGPTYKARLADENHDIRCLVWGITAWNESLNPAFSNILTVLAPAGAAPVNTAAPTVAGLANPAQEMSGGLGTWTGSPTAYDRWWESSADNGATWAAIVGATGPYYTPVDGDVGKRVRHAVKAYNAASPGGVTAFSAPVTVTAAAGSAAQTLAYDQTIVNPWASEQLPRGAAKDDAAKNITWAYNPRAKTQPSWNGAKASALTMWGQLYEWRAGQLTPCWAEIADAQLWVKRADTGAWVLAQHSKTVPAPAQGAHYKEDFATNSSAKATTMAGAGGGTKVRLGTFNPAGRGWNYHFWPAGARFDLTKNVGVNNVAGVVGLFRARLDPDTYDPAAQYVASAGFDWYANVSASFPQNADGAMGRFKVLDANWKVFMGGSPTTLANGSMFTPLGVANASEYR